MKKILLINFILIQTLIFSQESLYGKYCHSFDDVYSCINFLENQRFEYNSGGDLGDSYIGAGKYQLVNKELILIFDKAEKAAEIENLNDERGRLNKENDDLKKRKESANDEEQLQIEKKITFNQEKRALLKQKIEVESERKDKEKP